MRNSKYVWGVIGLLALILLIFTTGVSEDMEIVVELILAISSCRILINAITEKKNKGQYAIVGVIGLCITIGLFTWSNHNDRIRIFKGKAIEKENLNIQFAERAKQDSLQHISDSIQNNKDSLAIVEDSKRLYAQEGDSIFGDFKFGMSEKQCEVIQNRIQKETNGRITIANHDFRIDECRYHNHKLYYIRLKSANTWVRYYFHDAHEYDDSEGLGDGKNIVERIKKRLSLKYGNPNNSGNWHFTYKDITVRSGLSYKSREGLLSTEYWGVFLTISNPQLAEEAQIAEHELKNKVDAEKKNEEEDIRRKKESFADGL